DDGLDVGHARNLKGRGVDKLTRSVERFLDFANQLLDVEHPVHGSVVRDREVDDGAVVLYDKEVAAQDRADLEDIQIECAQQQFPIARLAFLVIANVFDDRLEDFRKKFEQANGRS